MADTPNAYKGEMPFFLLTCELRNNATLDGKCLPVLAF